MISILMPARIDSTEKQEWINEAVQSIQFQTFKDWEIIIVDDASPYSINLLEPDERIRIVRTTKQSGPSLCRNDAAALAQFECLLPLDADDKLAGPDVLSAMYLIWEQNKDKIIYGDLQQLVQIDGIWKEGKIFDLPEYSFDKVLDLGGIIPVTAMHSKDCHIAAGGWKSKLNLGLEDVEYWIAAGKAGFCGYRVQGIVLQYRKHFESRSYQLRENRQESGMRNLIKEMHQDVYERRFPMGCCGGGKPYTPPVSNGQKTEARISTLNQVSADQKVWVEYNGLRQGSFGVVGKSTSINYVIDGPGYKFEVHVKDLPIFQKQRGINGIPAFLVGIPSPMAEIKMQTNEPPFRPPNPELAQIVQLDR